MMTMMKGIMFDGVHSYADMNLVLSKVNIPPAQAKTNYVDVPGADGSIDLTEAHGRVFFADRECAFTFTVFPWEDFETKKTDISNFLNGKRCKIVLDKDPDYYWEGRCFVNEYASDKNIHKIVVGATVAPYKLKHEKTVVKVQGSAEYTTVRLHNGRKPVCPIVECSNYAMFKFNGVEFEVPPGTHKVLDMVLCEGYNELAVVSQVDVTITYQEGDL